MYQVLANRRRGIAALIHPWWAGLEQLVGARLPLAISVQFASAESVLDISRYLTRPVVRPAREKRSTPASAGRRSPDSAGRL